MPLDRLGEVGQISGESSSRGEALVRPHPNSVEHGEDLCIPGEGFSPQLKLSVCIRERRS